MKKYLIFIVSILVLFTATTIVVAKSNPNGDPFQNIWDAIVGLVERVGNNEDNVVELETKVQTIENDLNSTDYAFCQECDNTPWNCTRQEAAEQCESLGMHLCSLAELNSYTELGYSSCCWAWVSDPDLESKSRTKGVAAYFMGPSTRTGIGPGCGGDPGGLRITTGYDHLNKTNTHCCK